MLAILAMGRFPIYENTTGHRCFRKETVDAVKSQISTSKYGQTDQWYLVNKSDSLLHYKIYCDYGMHLV